MGLYADPERGRYPVWQSLDHKNFFPGSRIFFVTVTVGYSTFVPQNPRSKYVFLIQGDYSVRVEALPDSQVQEEVMGVIRSMFPNITVPEPVAFHFPRWHSDPLFRGSYSNWPPSFFGGHHQNLRAPVEGRLWFAGEATSQKYFGKPSSRNQPILNFNLLLLGFLHGAYFEGHDVALAIANCVRGKGCVRPSHVEEVTNARPYDI